MQGRAFMERGPVSRSKKFEPERPPANGFSVHPKLFIFFDKKTGTRRFEVDAGADGSMPMDQAGSLLAIHCVARQQMPRDFDVMVAAGEDLVDGLVGRATKLMRTCSGYKSPVPLSRRQHEVLDGVAQNLSNKEIAVRLNVSVRTVKFHVSTLLAKFGVCGRVDLMLEAADFPSPEAIHKRRENPARLALSSPALPPAVISPDARPRMAIPLDRRSSR
jgi:DNA-binding CsgD family transcriptional regulator